MTGTGTGPQDKGPICHQTNELDKKEKQMSILHNILIETRPTKEGPVHLYALGL